MLQAEANLPKKRRRDWSKELSEIIHSIRYYRLLLSNERSGRIHSRVIKKVGKKAAIKDRPKGIQEIRKSIKAEWNRLAAYKKEAEEKRDKFLEECLESSSVGDEKRRNAIQQIRRRERSKRRFRKIWSVLQRLKSGGLTYLYVPIYDQEDNIIGWESVTNKEEVHQVLTERNNKHLN